MGKHPQEKKGGGKEIGRTCCSPVTSLGLKMQISSSSLVLIACVGFKNKKTFLPSGGCSSSLVGFWLLCKPFWECRERAVYTEVKFVSRRISFLTSFSNPQG